VIVNNAVLETRQNVKTHQNKTKTANSQITRPKKQWCQYCLGESV